MRIQTNTAVAAETSILAVPKDPETQGVAIFVDIADKTPCDTSGLTITIPVAADDIEEVNKLIAKHLWRFDPQPISSVPLKQVTHLIKTPLFSLRPAPEETYYGRNAENSAHAIMGGIAYPIDPDSLGLSYSDPIKKVLNAPIDIHFELGEVCPTMNRERLNYQPRTIEGVKAKVALVLTTLRDYVTEQVANQPNLWSARQFWQKELTSEIRELLRDTPPTYQTHSLSDSFTAQNPVGASFISISDKQLGLQRPNLSPTHRVHAFVNTIFLSLDPASPISPSSLQRRLVRWGLSRRKHVVIIKATPQLTSEILDLQFGGAPLTCQIDDTTMPDPGLVRSSSDYANSPRLPLAKFHQVDRYDNRREVTLDPNISHIYVITKSWKPIDPLDTKNIGAGDLAQLVKTHFERDLILIPATFKKPPNTNWVNAFDALRAMAQHTLQDPAFLRALQVSEDLSGFDGTDALKLIQQFGDTAPTKPRSLIGKLYARRLQLKAQPQYPNMAELRSLIRMFGLTPPTLTPDPTLKPQIEAVEAAYPLIQLISETVWRKPPNTAAHWVAYANSLSV